MTHWGFWAYPLRVFLKAFRVIACIPFTCLFAPIRLVRTLVTKYQRYESENARKRKARQLIINSMPVILGPRLTRRLTIGHGEDDQPTEPLIPSRENSDSEQLLHVLGGNKQNIDLAFTSDQNQSPLFKAPLEIRQQIYEYVLGGCNIHIHFLMACESISPQLLPRSKMGHCQLREDRLYLSGTQLNTTRRTTPQPESPPRSWPNWLCQMYMYHKTADWSEAKRLLPLPLTCRRV